MERCETPIDFKKKNSLKIQFQTIFDFEIDLQPEIELGFEVKF